MCQLADLGKETSSIYWDGPGCNVSKFKTSFYIFSLYTFNEIFDTDSGLSLDSFNMLHMLHTFEVNNTL